MKDRITLRFLASPQDSAVGGTTVAAGRVLEWIDKAGYACAVGWSGSYCVTAYVGNVHFTAPIRAGELVEAHASIIHTGRTSMQVLVVIEAADVQSRAYTPAMHCILVFVAVDDDGAPRAVPEWTPSTDAERLLNERAVQRLAARRDIRDAMVGQRYSDEGTTPRTVFRFLAAPSAANWGGNAHGGTVMGWIDETAYACAVGWSSAHARAVYSGGIHFFRPIRIGHVVEVEARLIHTGARSMHIAVHVRSGSASRPDALEPTTQCMSIFVDPGPDGRARPVRPLELRSDEDRHSTGTHASSSGCGTCSARCRSTRRRPTRRRPTRRRSTRPPSTRPRSPSGRVRSGRGPHDSVLVRVHDGVHAIAEPELHEHLRHVRLHGRLADPHALGDLGVRDALGEQLQHLAFSVGERRELIRLGRRSRRRRGRRHSAAGCRHRLDHAPRDIRRQQRIATGDASTASMSCSGLEFFSRNPLAPASRAANR